MKLKFVMDLEVDVPAGFHIEDIAKDLKQHLILAARNASDDGPHVAVGNVEVQKEHTYFANMDLG